MSENRVFIAHRYERGALIGRGGMGDVYRGLDTYNGQMVAIKHLHQSVVQENPNILDRFQREGEALSRLDHPNIVKILATIEEEGQHYLIMEYVGGGSLRDLIDKQSRLPIQRALNIALDLADALARAHRLNIIHRDIKPDNVLLADDGTPRLTDFGVAHMADRTRLTLTGSVIGTYAYLSPEACNGLELDERADIWSFGVVLFEMLAGRPPFDGSGTAAVLTSILTKPAPDLARLRPDTPPTLVNLIEGMLEKDRERRISSVRIVGAELEVIIRGLATPTRGFVTGSLLDGSRFITPPEPDSVRAMVRSTPYQTHGPSLYPTPSGQAPPPGTPPPPYSPTPLPGETPVPPAGNTSKWVSLLFMVIVLALAAVSIVWLVVSRDDDESPSPGATPNAAASSATPEPTATLVPVAASDYMVLVTDLEQLGPERRLVRRTIVDDLALRLEQGVPYSNVRVRTHDGVLTSPEQARALAEATGAAVVVWGSYTPASVQLEIQLGSTIAFSSLAFPRDLLERSANLRLTMTDERAQSIAPDIIGILALLNLASGDAFGYMRTLAVLNDLQVRPAPLEGTTSAVHIHRFFHQMFGNTPEALNALDTLITEDPTNPFGYILRAQAYQRQGRAQEAAQDAETAARLGPPYWATPLYVLSSENLSYPDALNYYSRIIQLRPNDWFPLTLRGATYYMMGDLARARADLNQAITFGPSANFPYVFLALIHLAEGDFEAAGASIRVTLQNFPDPDFYSRLVHATLGREDRFSPIISAFTHLLLARYDQAVEAAERALGLVGFRADLQIMLGQALCSRGDYTLAEIALTKAIDAGSDQIGLVIFPHLLRADVRQSRRNDAGAQEDLDRLREVGGPGLLPLIELVESGEIGCQNVLGNTALASATVPASASATPPPGSTATPLDAGTPTPALAVADLSFTVEPVQAGEYMVLVADLEAADGIEQLAGIRPRDTGRFIANDLERTLEQSVPFSDIRIRRYPKAITFDDEARAVAAQYGATVIVWGSYVGDMIELEVQIGMIDSFGYNNFSREMLERSANVRVQLTDARQTSIAPHVLGALAVLQTADGDAHEAMRTLAVLEAIQVTPAEIKGNTVATHAHRGFQSMLDNPREAVDQIDAALDLDAGNPLLYTYRNLANQRLGRTEEARRDAETAQRLGPINWTMPMMLLTSSYSDAGLVLEMFGRIIWLRPNDWYPFFVRGSLYYDLAEYDLARADLERAIALEPNANYPYVYAAILALREGRLPDAWTAIGTILGEYPDPSFMNRLIEATFGENFASGQGATISAFGNLVLGRYYETLEATAQGLTFFDDFTDLYLMQGFAYCALNNYQAAEASYTRSLEIEPGFVLAHLLRSEVRMKRKNFDGAAQDVAAIRASAEFPTFEPLVRAMQSGTLGCGNFFNPDNTLFQATSTPAPTPAATADSVDLTGE